MATDPFEEALVYEDDLPLDWEVVTELPSVQRLAGLNAANEALLRAREGLEEPPRVTEESNELAPELQRLDSKLNLLLELLADWLRRQGDLPSAQSVRFNARRIAWETEDPPAPDSLLRMQLYVCPTFPRPLVLYGRVLHEEDGATGTLAVATFLDLSPGVVGGLERLIFRRHRREVAQLRGQLRGGSGRD